MTDLHFCRITFILVLALLVFGERSLQAQSLIEIPLKTTTYTTPGPDNALNYLFLKQVDKKLLGLKKEPVYRSTIPLYGQLEAGNASRRFFAVAFDDTEGAEPQVYVDINGNHDLTDDVMPDWIKSEEGVLYKDILIKAEFVVEGKTQIVASTFRCLHFTKMAQPLMRFAFQPRDARTGTMTIGNKRYPVLLKTSDKVGLYSDLEKLTIGFDLNDDNKIDESRLTGELFEGNKPFNIGGESYQIASASAFGDKISLVVSPAKVARKYHIVTGEVAPDFSFQTIQGKTLKLSDLRGKVVMLDFWATWCSPCLAVMPENQRLYQQYDRAQFEVIGVSLDGKVTDTNQKDVENAIAKHQIKWLVTFDNSGFDNVIAKTYNVMSLPVHIIIDKQGIIRQIERPMPGDVEKIKILLEQLTKEK